MHWRFWFDGAHDAATNMARDEALLLSALSQSSPPTVRLYTWSRPSLTIGYRQRLEEACDVDQCQRLGIATVRRISGGRAVLHHRELTYCIAAPMVESFRGLSVRGVYTWVTGAIREALEALGIKVDRHESPARPVPPASLNETAQRLPCFAVPTGHEITAGGRKLVGAAQKWSRRGFLQHGSILFSVDSRLWRQVTGLSPGTDLGAVGLEALSRRRISIKDLVNALEERFGVSFGEPAGREGLSPEENAWAKKLTREKYSSPSWNVRHQFPVPGSPPHRQRRDGTLKIGQSGLF